VKLEVAPGVALHVEVHGEGPAVVLGHGFGGSARNWGPQVRTLRDRFRVVVYDARGHARSDAPEAADAYTLDTLRDDLARVVDAHGDAPCAVGGLSMGAGVALGFALAAPERVRRLVLMAPPPLPDEHGARGRGWAADFARAIDAQGLDAAGERFAWGERSGLDPAARRLVRQGFLEHPPHALAHTLRGVLDAWPSFEAIAPDLGALRVPTLLVVGDRDRPSRAIARRLAEALPEATLEVVADAGHVVNLAARERVNALLADFLSG
jgi:2-succinyl-6-hydroxy-2,4-cyclohexadiene-1-carboxylate synthase